MHSPKLRFGLLGLPLRGKVITLITHITHDHEKQARACLTTDPKVLYDMSIAQITIMIPSTVFHTSHVVKF